MKDRMNTGMKFALKELQDACEFGKDTPYVVQCIATAVANLIMGAGRFGGTEQRNTMDLAVQYGFQPEYWADTIRVTYTGAK
jgi:hypothetical protein